MRSPPDRAELHPGVPRRTDRLHIQKPGGTMAPSAFRVRQMPSVLLYRRSEKFDPERFLDEDVVCWGNHTSVTDSLGIKGKRSVMLTALRLLLT